MKKLLTLVIATFLTPGCNTTLSVADKIYERWHGVHVQEFFLKYGQPSTVFHGEDKRIAYTWIGGQARVTMPDSAYSPVSGGEELNIGCIAHIYTTNHIITGITLKDTVGGLGVSRCNEVFYPDFTDSYNSTTYDHTDDEPINCDTSEENSHLSTIICINLDGSSTN